MEERGNICYHGTMAYDALFFGVCFLFFFLVLFVNRYHFWNLEENII